MNDSSGNTLVDNNPEDKKWFWLFVKIGGAIVLLWVLSAVVIVYASDSAERRGQFGDMFGAINALFAGLAFVGLIVAILMQREELQLQREDLALQRNELELTRKELEGQKQQMELQNKTLRRQQFEATFFQMLSLHNQNVNAMDLPFVEEGDGYGAGEMQQQNVLKGRDCLRKMYERFKDDNAHYQFIPTVKEEIVNVSSVWVSYFQKYQSDLAHYFRFLFNIVKFVKRAEEIENKKFYTNIVRAQLSDFEVALLCYNCIAPYGRIDFRPLVIEFELDKHLDSDILIDPQHVMLLRSQELELLAQEQKTKTKSIL